MSSPVLEVFKQGLTLQGGGGGDCSTWLEVGLFILGRSGVTWVSALPTPASGGPSLTGLGSEPGGAELTTPTEVKAATELMMVGMMLNLPACMNEDRSEWAGVRQARWPGVELGLPARRTVEWEG